MISGVVLSETFLKLDKNTSVAGLRLHRKIALRSVRNGRQTPEDCGKEGFGCRDYTGRLKPKFPPGQNTSRTQA